MTPNRLEPMTPSELYGLIVGLLIASTVLAAGMALLVAATYGVTTGVAAGLITLGLLIATVVIVDAVAAVNSRKP